MITCLVCTLLDFPTWTLTQRTAYINGDNGATKKDIKVSTIEKACENLRFTVHTTRYSPPARNSFGFVHYELIGRSMFHNLFKMDQHVSFLLMKLG